MDSASRSRSFCRRLVEAKRGSVVCRRARPVRPVPVGGPALPVAHLARRFNAAQDPTRTTKMRAPPRLATAHSLRAGPRRSTCVTTTRDELLVVEGHTVSVGVNWLRERKNARLDYLNR